MNRISALVDSQGTRVNDPALVKDIVLDLYKCLLGSSPVQEFSSADSDSGPCITAD